MDPYYAIDLLQSESPAMDAQQPIACTLFKGTRKQAAYTPSIAWTLRHQHALLTSSYSRQAHRQNNRMLKKKYRLLGDHPAIEEPGDANDADSDDDPVRPTGRLGAKKRVHQDDSDSSPIQPQKRSRRSKKSGGDSEDGEDKSGDGSGSDGDGDGDGDRNEDNSRPSARRSGKLRRRKTPNQPPTIDVDASEGAQQVANLVSELVKCNDVTLRNARRIARNLKDLKLSQVVAPVLPKASEGRLQQLISGPAVAGRDIRPLQRKRDVDYNKSRDTDRWVFTFANGQSTTQATGTSMRFPFSVLATDASTAEQDALHAELARIYNAWPWKIDSLNQMVKQQIVATAVSNVFARPLQVDEVTHSNTLTYQTKVHYIEAKTGSHMRLNISATATEAAMSKVSVPRLPLISIRKTSDQSIISMTPDQPHHTAAPQVAKLGKNQKTSTSVQHIAENAVYWVAAQLQGLTATEDRMKQLHAMYRQQIGLQKGAAMKEGVYGGEADLYTFSYRKADCVTIVQPTKKIADDLSQTQWGLSLYIHSLNASRATPVMETVLQLFCNGDDIRYAWLEAARSADYVNADIGDGVPPSSQCDCSESQAGTEMHVCEGCTRPVICKTRAYDSMGRLVCATCQQRDQNQSVGGRDPGETLASFLANRSLRINFRRECTAKALNPDDKKNHTIYRDAWAQIKASLPGAGITANLASKDAAKYIDQWTGKTFDVGEERTSVGNNPSRRRYVPGGLTVDSVHRQGKPSNASLLHSADNLRITSNACQFAKGKFNSGVLHEIGEFKRLSPEKQASDSARKALIDKTTAMAVVDCKRAYINAGRGDANSKYQKILAESIAGMPTPNEAGPWDQMAKQYVEKDVPSYQTGVDSSSLWDNSSWSRAQQCAISMEEHFGVKLHTLQDGTRWIGAAYSNPHDLDRNGVWMVCQERLARLRVKCNKKWQTRDTEETLYREILFQYCCSMTTKPTLQALKEKYGDRLGLPLVLWKFTPLRFSVAHRTHGFGMFTGWLSDATDIQERLDNDDENNLLIESYYLNVAKLDMAEEYYAELDEILTAAVITDKSIYDPTNPPSVQGAVATKDDIPLIDEFIGATFEDSLLSSTEDAGVAGVGDSGGGGGGDGDGEAAPKAGVAQAKGGQKGEVSGTADPPQGVDLDQVNPDLQSAFQDVYRTIVNDDTLREWLVIDRDLSRALARLSRIADGQEPGDAHEIFGSCLGEIYERWITPAGST